MLVGKALFGGSSPTVKGTNTGQETSNVTFHSIALPSSIAVGELLIVFFSHNGGAVGGGITINTGISGVNWNTIAEASHTGTGFTNAAYWKIAEGSDALTLQTGVSARTSAHVSARIAGGVSVSNAVSGTSTTSTNPDPPNLAPGSTKEFLWLAMAANDTVLPSAAPSNYASLVTSREATNGTTVAIAQRNLAGSSENPGTFTASSDAWIARTFAIHPY